MVSQKWTDGGFGKRLRGAREDRGWTQGDLSERLAEVGVTITPLQVARMEKGERSVRATEAAALADLYGVSVDGLLGRHARPVADLNHAIRVLLDAKNQAAWQLSVVERTLTLAAAELEGADTADRYPDLAAETRDAASAVADALSAIENVGQSTNPTVGALMREDGMKALDRLLAADGEPR